MRPLAATAFAYLSFMWGSTYLFIKIGLDYWPPFLLASTRNFVACLVLLVALFALHRPIPNSWRGWWPPLAFGVINGSAFAFIFWGEQYIPSGQTAVLIAAVPLFTIFLAWWWLGEPPTWLKTAAVVVGLAGVLLATGHREGAGFVGTGTQRLAGQAAMLGAALCYAVSYIFGKKYFRADIYFNTSMHLASSAVYLLVLALLFDPPVTSAVLAWPSLGSLLYLALPGSALAYLAMFYLVQNATPLQTTYFSMINPIVAVLLGVTLMGETLTTSTGIGAALVVAGVWLVSR